MIDDQCWLRSSCRMLVSKQTVLHNHIFSTSHCTRWIDVPQTEQCEVYQSCEEHESSLWIHVMSKSTSCNVPPPRIAGTIAHACMYLIVRIKYLARGCNLVRDCRSRTHVLTSSTSGAVELNVGLDCIIHTTVRRYIACLSFVCSESVDILLAVTPVTLNVRRSMLSSRGNHPSAYVGRERERERAFIAWGRQEVATHLTHSAFLFLSFSSIFPHSSDLFVWFLTPITTVCPSTGRDTGGCDPNLVA